MEGVEIIPLILKYFDFQQLCIAERINPFFKHFVAFKLRLLKFVDFNRIFAHSKYSTNIYEKICYNCPNLCTFIESSEFICNEFSIDNRTGHYAFLKRLQRLKKLNLNCCYYGIINFTDLLDNAGHLSHLIISFNPLEHELDNGSCDQFNKSLRAHKKLQQLEIHSQRLWMNCLEFENLSHLKIQCSAYSNCGIYHKLHILLDNNKNLEVFDVYPIPPDHLLIIKLMKLKKLRKLHLAIQQNDSFSSHSNWCDEISDELLFRNLQDLSISYNCKIESHFAIVLVILTRSLSLKRCQIMSGGIKPCTYMQILKSICHPEHLECFYFDNVHTNALGEFSAPIFDEIVTRMKNLRHLDVSCLVPFKDTEKIATLEKMAYLEIMQERFDIDERLDKWDDAIHVLCTSSFKAVKIQLRCCTFCPTMMDSVFEKCPNLTHLSMFHAIFPKDHMKRLPLALPKLELLEVALIYIPDEEDYEPQYACANVDDLVETVKNLPNLRVLSTWHREYRMLLENDWIKKYSRQGKLSIMKSDCDGHRFCPEICCKF